MWWKCNVSVCVYALKWINVVYLVHINCDTKKHHWDVGLYFKCENLIVINNNFTLEWIRWIWKFQFIFLSKNKIDQYFRRVGAACLSFSERLGNIWGICGIQIIYLKIWEWLENLFKTWITINCMLFCIIEWCNDIRSNWIKVMTNSIQPYGFEKVNMWDDANENRHRIKLQWKFLN